MNAHRPVTGSIETEISADGELLLPEEVQRATGLLPGRRVVIGINERREIVIATRTQAKRRGEAPTQRAERLDRALAALGDRFATGEASDDIMEMLRGPRSE